MWIKLIDSKLLYNKRWALIILTKLIWSYWFFSILYVGIFKRGIKCSLLSSQFSLHYQLLSSDERIY